MKVLVACEFSGIVRDAFIKNGHDAMSCDIFPPESLGPHFEGDVIDILPAHEVDQGVRVEFFGDEIESLAVIDAITGRQIEKVKKIEKQKNSERSQKIQKTQNKMLFQILLIFGPSMDFLL